MIALCTVFLCSLKHCVYVGPIVFISPAQERVII